MALMGLTVIRRTSVQAIVTGAWRTVQWQVEDYDNLGAVDLGVSNTQIIVPTGVGVMRAALRTSWQNSGTSGRYINLLSASKNYLGDIRAAINESMSSIQSGWQATTPAEVLTLEVNSGGNSIDLGSTFGGFPTLTIEWAASFADVY